jgi:hypothetical protein
MAISVGEQVTSHSITLVHFCKAVLVGEAQSWLPELIDRARKLKVNGGFEPGADLSVTNLAPDAIR